MWRGVTENGVFSVEIAASVLDELDGYCRDAGIVETGGIMIGHYSDDLKVAKVTEVTSPPPDSNRGHTWFVRGKSGLRAILGKRWRTREQSYYIGEWHFHPASIVEPSSEDFAQMKKISYSQEYHCTEPLLLIFCDTRGQKARPFRIFVCPAGKDSMEFHRSVMKT